MKPYPNYKSSGAPWLGVVPTHWKLSGLKFQLERNDGGAWGDDPDGAESTIVLRSTEQTVDGRWKIDDPAKRKLTNAEAEATLLIEGDLLVTKSSGSETHIGKTSLVDKNIEDLKAGYSNFMQRLRVQPDIFPKYIWFLLNSDTTKTQINILASTTTGLANLNAGVLNRILLAYPPFSEQKAISNYLDTETARIDDLIREKDELIGLLKEWRQSAIAEAITKGLNFHTKMKTSSVPWLKGSIPAHWELKRIKHLAFMQSGEGITSDGIEDFGTYPVYGGNGVRGFTNRATHNGEYVLVGRQGALCGNVHLVKGEFWASEHAIVSLLYAGDNARWTKFMFEFMNLGQYSMASAQPGISVDKIQQLLLPVPPKSEQKEIADYLDIETAKIDKLITHTTDEIALLKELRAATIADAVLGRIDVRTKQ